MFRYFSVGVSIISANSVNHPCFYLAPVDISGNVDIEIKIHVMIKYKIVNVCPICRL